MESQIPSKQRSQSKFKANLIIYGILVGIVSGFLSVAYRYAISKMEVLRHLLYHKISFPQILIYILAILAISYFISKLLQWAPFSNGSGIPQIKAEVLDQIDEQPIPTIISKFLGGSLNNLLGYSVGREGPSIQMGGMAAKWIAQKCHLDSLETKYLTTAGASAGLSAAFNAPLAGTLFALEEIYGSLSHFIMIPCIIASVIANYMSFKLMGFESSFSFKIHQSLPIDYLPGVALLGVFAGLISVVFNNGLDFFRKCFIRLNISKFQLITLISLLMFIIGFVEPDLQGGGHHLIENLTQMSFSLRTLLILLLGKLLLTLICFNSGVQGGIFLPVLVVGALIGTIFYQVNIGGIIPEGYAVNYLILGMVGVLAGVVRAPLMSIILVTEMTGSFSHLISMTTVAIIALFTADLLHCKPVYETLYENLLSKVQTQPALYDDALTLTDYNIDNQSTCVNIPLKTLAKPKYFMIVEIIRNGIHIIPTATDVINPLDKISVLHYRKDTEAIDHYFKNTQ